MNYRRIIQLWGPVVVYMAAIFYVSSLPEAPLPPGLPDKPAHALGYMGFGFVIARALAGGLPPRITTRQFFIGLAIAVAYGASDEFHQRFVPGRTGELADLYADTVGAAIELIACWAWGIISLRSRQPAVSHCPLQLPAARCLLPAMSFDNLLLERDGAVAIITINRPAVLNALNTPTTDELGRAILELKRDAAVRVVIITGAGEKAFIAGADINELAVLKPAQGKEHAQRGQHVLDLIENMGKPVIAAINGFALGGGCELAMACTLRIAADTARFGQPEINLGIIPGYAGTQRLSRLVGKGIALDLLLTGRQIKADEALQIGLVNRVVPAPQLMTEAKALAAEFASKAPVALQFIIEAVNRGLEVSFDKGQFLEATLFGLVASTADMREGTRAFLEKRKAQFKGE